MDKFKLVSDFKPTGDQPEAIEKLVEGIKKGYRFQTLLGVTGSGKLLRWQMSLKSSKAHISYFSQQDTCCPALFGI